MRQSKHIVLSLVGLVLLSTIQPSVQAQTLGETGARAVSENYLLGPGDVLNVFVWRNPDLSVTVPVRPDGRITTPLVEDLVVAGKTTVQVAREIESVLAEYVKTPQVNVIVSSAASVMSQVKVIGQVKSAKAVTFTDGMTVLDVLLAVDGLGEFAAGNRAKILRKVSGKEVEIRVKLEDIQQGDLKTNVPVKPGDVLVVPESLF
jgi:polysaccharide biosynthesis/export protein